MAIFSQAEAESSPDWRIACDRPKLGEKVGLGRALVLGSHLSFQFSSSQRVRPEPKAARER